MGFLNNLFKKSKNDVYICYDDGDEQIARDVCRVLEDNRMNFRVKFRDFKKKDLINQVTDAISASGLMVMIYSENAANSNFIKSEVDWAFSEGVPICTFKVEDIDISGGLEFYLKNQPIVDAYPDYKDNYENLIITAMDILGIDVKIKLPSKEKKIEKKSSDNFTHDAFISYSTRDMEIADEICETIENSGFKCWIAPRDIPVAKNFAQSTMDGINNAKIFVPVLSKSFMESKYVLQELQNAFSQNKHIIGFNIDGTIPEGDYALYLKSAQWAYYPEDLKLGIESISKYLGKFFRPTEITLLCDRDSCEVYEKVHVKGTLKSGNEVLKNENIKILVNGSLTDEIISNDDGSYECEVSFLESGSNTVTAIFKKETYLKSSADAEIIVSKAGSEITFNATSDSVAAGSVIALSGNVRSVRSDLPIRRSNVDVFNGDELVESTITNDEGNFSVVLPAAKLGTFVFRAIFDGDEFMKSCESPSVEVNVIDSIPQDSAEFDANLEKPFPAYSGDEPYIFISYAHKDAEIVFPEIKRFHDEGYNIWYDQGLTPGQEWDDEVAEALLGCSLLVVFISKNSMGSTNVQDEIKLALDEKIDIVPIYFEDTKLPPGLRLRLSNKHAIFKYSLSPKDYIFDCFKAFDKANIPK